VSVTEAATLWVNGRLLPEGDGARVIGLPIPWSHEELAGAIAQTLQVNGLQQAVVRLTLSRGVPTARGLLPAGDPQPTVVVHAQPFHGYEPALYQRGMRAVTSDIRRNEHSPTSNIKSLSYLDNILARQGAAQRGADEALLCNTAGELTCASAANVFVVVDGILLTPPVSSGALPGTVRGALLSLAPQLGIRVEERVLYPAIFRQASEAFLTNALMGVMPLISVDEQAIGADIASDVTRRIRVALEHELHHGAP
jgi:branched-chain amino acid aminotransferase